MTSTLVKSPQAKPPPLWIRLIRTLSAFTVLLAIGGALIYLGARGGVHWTQSPNLDCNGNQMSSGDVCHMEEYRNGVLVRAWDETYEQRLKNSHHSIGPNMFYVAGSWIDLAILLSISGYWAKISEPREP